MLLRIPLHGRRPFEIRDALFRVYPEAEHVSLYYSDAEYSDRLTPLNRLRRAFVTEPGGAAPILASVADLRNTSELSGKIVWIDNCAKGNLPKWIDVLRENSELNRRLDSIWDRTIFILSLENDLAVSQVSEDVCLAVRSWYGVVSRIDSLLFAAGYLSDRNISSLEKEAAIHVIANLAEWDLELVEFLASQSMRDLLSPGNALKTFSSRRAWQHVYGADWHLGQVDYFDVGPTRSILLDCATNQFEITQRLWTAQIAVVLPLIEKKRREIIDQYEKNLSTWIQHLKPTDSRGRLVDDFRTLEVGPLCYIFSRTAARDPVFRTLKLLKDLRNKLAHLETLSADDLDDLKSIFG